MSDERRQAAVESFVERFREDLGVDEGTQVIDRAVPVAEIIRWHLAELDKATARGPVVDECTVDGDVVRIVVDKFDAPAVQMLCRDAAQAQAIHARLMGGAP